MAKICKNKVISVIGMPGSGKSTVGAILAKKLTLPFIDTDILIQRLEDATLAEIIVDHDHKYLRQIEEKVLLEMPIHRSVIATGGSVVYSHLTMTRLTEQSTIVYLKASLATVAHRISLAPDRGIASPREYTLEDVYRERIPMYERYADITVVADNLSPEYLADQIARSLST